jgi:hypothetical protein
VGRPIKGVPTEGEEEMTHNLKAFGLVLAAILALSAISASAASAQAGKLTSTGPVTLKATQTGEAKENQDEAFGLTVRCPNLIYTGHKVNVTPHEAIPSGASEITITPHYGACTGLGFPTTINMNSCDYAFDIKETVAGGTDEYNVDTTIKCAAGLHIKKTMFTTTAYNWSEVFCEVEITEKATAYTGLVFKDTTNGFGDIRGTIGGVEEHKRPGSHSSIFCPAPETTTTTGTIKLDITVEGRNPTTGTQTNISLSHA